MVSGPIGAVVAEHEATSAVRVAMQSVLAGVRKFTVPVGVL